MSFEWKISLKMKNFTGHDEFVTILRPIILLKHPNDCADIDPLLTEKLINLKTNI